MPTIREALEHAVSLHRQGNLPGAEQVYRQVLAADPKNANAWHLLGLVAHARGDHAAARETIERAIVLEPVQGTFHLHLADVLRSLRRFDAALASCRRAIQLQETPAALNTLGAIFADAGRHGEAAEAFRRAIALDANLAIAHNNLAASCFALGELDEAIAAARRAIELDPALAAAHDTLGLIFGQQGRADEAIAAYWQALALETRLPQTEFRLGAQLQLTGALDEAAACYRRAIALDANHAEAWCNLGSVLKDQGRAGEAEQCYRRAIALRGNLAQAHFNLGVLLQSHGIAGDARTCYEQTLRIDPNYAEAYNNLGTLYRIPGDFTRATELYTKALECKPNFAEALNNLGNLMKLQGRIDEARVAYEQTLRINPDYTQARYNVALLHLADGDYARGFAEYEWRRECPEFVRHAFASPRWQGEPLAGRTLLLHFEQGLGDTLQFIRYLPEAARLGSLVVQVQKPLLPILEQSGFGRFAQLVGKGDPLPAFDCYASLLSLPAIFGTRLDSIPSAAGYLSADPARVEHWRGVLRNDAPSTAARLKVGIVWQGSRTHIADRFRSLKLTQFTPLALPGVELVSLQKGYGSEQMAELAGRFAVRDLGEVLDASSPFLDTAAVIQNLDLVIACDTAVAHLAGALGAPVWVALGFEPDWRWLRGRSTTPWYASMRLFRQTKFDDWSSVLAEMAAALVERVASHG